MFGNAYALHQLCIFYALPPLRQYVDQMSLFCSNTWTKCQQDIKIIQEDQIANERYVREPVQLRKH